MLELLLLGPFEVRRDGILVSVRGVRQRALLASLALAAGEAVPAATLIASVWGSADGPRAGHSLHEAISKLRRTLGEQGVGDLIASRDGGAYALASPGLRIDAVEFERLAADAFGEPGLEARAHRLQQALDLWRGAALEGIALEGDARADGARLDDLRLRCTQAWIEARLELGDPEGVLPDLERLAAEHPYDEHLCEQLMLALYRTGRQADALNVYQRLRGRLHDELGLDPGERLRELERRILRHEPSLVPEAPPPTPPQSRRRIPRVVVAAGAAAAGIAAILAVVAFRPGAAAEHVVYADSLRGEVNAGFWDMATAGKGLSIRPTPDGVRLTLGAHATPAADGVMKAHLTSYCGLAGSFDVEVDYRLHDWPARNGVSVGMYAAFADVLRRSFGREDYVGTMTRVQPPDSGPARAVATVDDHGTLRIVRAGDVVLGEVRTGGAWRRLFRMRPTGATNGPNPVAVYLEAWTNADRFGHRQVSVEFSNFRLVSGTWEAPAFGGPPDGCPAA